MIQGTYRKAPLFGRYPVLEEVVGGLLGVVQGLLVLMFITIILDQFFLIPNMPADADELPFLRDVWNALNTSGTGSLLHGSLIPNFIGVTSFLIPESIRLLYGSG